MGFEPHFYRFRDRPSLDDLSEYVTMRVRKTHDLYHTISGFNMYVGEVGVIALNVTQYAYPAFMLIDLIAVGRLLASQVWRRFQNLKRFSLV